MKVLAALFLVLVPHVLAGGCPKRCTCTSDTIDCRGLKRFNFQIPNADNIIYFKVKDFDIDVIPTGAFSALTKIRRVRFVNGHIGEIQPGAFTGMNRRRKGYSGELFFMNVIVDHISTNGLGGITNLRAILAFWSRFNRISSGALTNSKINLLYISNSTVLNMEPIGEGLTVQRIEFQEGSTVPRIPENFLTGVTPINSKEDLRVDFYRSAVGAIEARAFQGIGPCRLYIAAGSIDRIEKDAFNGVVAKSEVYIGGNTIGTIDTGIFGRGSPDGAGNEVHVLWSDIGVLRTRAFAGPDTFNLISIHGNNVQCQEVGALDGIPTGDDMVRDISENTFQIEEDRCASRSS